MNLEFLLLAVVFATIVVPPLRDFGTNRFQATGLVTLGHVCTMIGFVWLRRTADDWGRPVLLEGLGRAESILFLGQIPSVWLQAKIYSPGLLHWYDYLAGLTYPAHFFVIWLAGAALWSVDHAGFCRYYVASTAQYLVSLPVFYLFPAAPPWLASEVGAIGPLDRIFAVVGASLSDATVRKGLDASGNDLAALPSIHMSVAMLVAVSLWKAGGWLRWIGVMYSALTLWSIVYGGEHYVLDALSGVALAFFSWRCAGMILRALPLNRA